MVAMQPVTSLVGYFILRGSLDSVQDAGVPVSLSLVLDWLLALLDDPKLLSVISC